MNSAAEILVIITSVVLVIFLIIAIVLVILVINLTRRIRRVAASGEVIAHNIERATSGLSKASTPLFFINLIRGFTGNKSTTKKGRKSNGKR